MPKTSRRQPLIWETLADSSAAAMAEPAGAVAESPGKLHLTIVRAFGLKHQNHFVGDAPYCVCTAARADKNPKVSKCRTKSLQNTLQPEWNEDHVIDPWNVGEALEFEVFDEGILSARSSGKASLASEQFYPQGFSGELELRDAPVGARLYVRIHAVKHAANAALRLSAAPTASLQAHALPSNFASHMNALASPPPSHSSRQMEAHTGSDAREAAMEENLGKLSVAIISATGLQSNNHFEGDSPSCVCQAVRGDKRAKPSKVETKALHKTLSPVWNEEHEIDPWNVGEALEFILYDNALHRPYEGRAIIPSDVFFPHGFEGELDLVPVDGAKLRVQIAPFGCDLHPEGTDSDPNVSCLTVEIHAYQRQQKGIEQNALAVSNRIRHFKKEEERVWRDLEQVRRQAAKIEEGRSRLAERELAEQAISSFKEKRHVANREYVKKHRDDGKITKAINTQEILTRRHSNADAQRSVAEDLQRKKQQELAQHSMIRSEKVSVMQRDRAEATLRLSQARSERLANMRRDREAVARRERAETQKKQCEARIPDLEEEELQCLQRLQHSRQVTMTVMRQLDEHFGPDNSTVANLLRSKTQQTLRQSQLQAGLSARSLGSPRSPYSPSSAR